MITGNTNGAPMAHPASTLSTGVLPPTSTSSRVAIDIPDNFTADHTFNLIKLLVKYRLSHLFHRLGRGAAIAVALSSDPKRGICGDGADVLRRKAEFGENTYPQPKPKSFFIHYLDALCDVVLLALLVCASVTLGFSIKDHGLKHALYGVAIFIAVFIYPALSAAASHWQAKQDDKLASESTNIHVNVVRDSRLQQVPKHDVVVGDVVKLKAGDAVPADGMFLTGRGLQLKVDESIISCDAKPVVIDNKKNPFLASGVKVVHGHGRMLVTAVGTNTAWGELMKSEKNGDDPQKLQERVEGLILTIGKIAVAFAVVTFTVLHRHFTGSAEKLQLLDNGIPLPLAVTLMLTFYLIRIVKHNTLVHRMSALETMASVTVICTDKTETLTPNQTKVIDLWVGTDQPRDATAIAGSVVRLLCQAVVVNTTGHVYEPDNVSPPEISGSPTEKALLSWAVAYLGMSAATFEKKSFKVLQVEVLRSVKKYRRAIARDNTTGKVVAHWKGDAEVVLAKCSMHVDTGGAARELAVEQRNKLEKVINDMTAGGVRCIAFAYKHLDDIEQSKKDEEEGLTLLGLVGLKDQCRPDVKGAVDACGKAGVTVKMLTRDNIVVARAIAMECGIISSNDPDDDAVIEGRQFRAMPAARQAEIVDKIRVIAKSGPLDKLVLVKRLKQKGHVVAVTGKGANDAAALKEADVVLSMSIQGTDVSKDTIILNDKFDTVVTAILSGRHAYNIFQRFSQFHITVNVVAMSVKFVSAITTGGASLTTVQLIMWVNLVMGTMSALAVALDKPSDALMNRPPVERTAPLISNAMWRNLSAQAAFQIAVLLAIQYCGTDHKANGTMIFNVFVLCQVLNEFNARDMERKNIFAGLLKSSKFLVVIAVALVLQAVLIELLTQFTGAERLGLGQWGICVAIAAVSWPIGWAVKFTPVPVGSLARRA